MHVQGTPQTMNAPSRYVVLTVGGLQDGDPAPAVLERLIPLRQQSVAVNVTGGGVCMEFSACADKQCVMQGKITPENCTTRAEGVYHLYAERCGGRVSAR